MISFNLLLWVVWIVVEAMLVAGCIQAVKWDGWQAGIGWLAVIVAVTAGKLLLEVAISGEFSECLLYLVWISWILLAISLGRMMIIEIFDRDFFLGISWFLLIALTFFLVNLLTLKLREVQKEEKSWKVLKLL